MPPGALRPAGKLALRRLVLTFLSMCVLPVSLARAQAVALDLTGCAEPAPSDVRALATLELRGRLRSAGDAEAAQHIVVTCMGERAELRAVERGDVRSVELGSVPTGLRARLLALSIAEVASVAGATRTGADEDNALQQAVPTPLRPAAAPAYVPPGPVSRDRPVAIVSMGARLAALPVVGGGVSLASQVRLSDALSWTGALTLGQTRRDIEGGRVRMRSLVLRSGPALTLERKRWLGYAGVAARVELLELVGEPRDAALFRAARVRTYVMGPALFTGVMWMLGRHVLFGLEAELAHQLRAVELGVRGGQSSTLSPWRLTVDAVVGGRW